MIINYKDLVNEVHQRYNEAYPKRELSEKTVEKILKHTSAFVTKMLRKPTNFIDINGIVWFGVSINSLRKAKEIRHVFNQAYKRQ